VNRHWENQAQYLARNGWRATLAPIDGVPLFKREAVEAQRAKDKRAVRVA